MGEKCGIPGCSNDSMWIEKFTVKNKWSHRGSNETKMYFCDFHYHDGKAERDEARLVMGESTKYYVALTTMKRKMRRVN